MGTNRNVGANNPNARLTEKDVRKIRRAAARASSLLEGNHPEAAKNSRIIGRLPYGWLAEKAREYNSSRGHIHDIVRGFKWGNVGGFIYCDYA